MSDSIPVDVVFEDEDPRIVKTLLNDIGAAEVQEVNRSGLTGIEILVAAVIFKGLPNLIGAISGSSRQASSSMLAVSGYRCRSLKTCPRETSCTSHREVSARSCTTGRCRHRQPAQADSAALQLRSCLSAAPVTVHPSAMSAHRHVRYGLTARAGPASSPPRFAGAQNTQIRAASVLIEIQPTSAHN